jgi:hypothetical protein
MRESMDKNRIKGVSVGRAGNLPRSAFRYRECQLVRGCRAPVAGAPLEDHKSVRFLYVPGDLREQAVGLFDGLLRSEVAESVAAANHLDHLVWICEGTRGAALVRRSSSMKAKKGEIHPQMISGS